MHQSCHLYPARLGHQFPRCCHRQCRYLALRRICAEDGAFLHQFSWTSGSTSAHSSLAQGQSERRAKVYCGFFHDPDPWRYESVAGGAFYHESIRCQQDSFELVYSTRPLRGTMVNQLRVSPGLGTNRDGGEIFCIQGSEAEGYGNEVSGIKYVGDDQRSSILLLKRQAAPFKTIMASRCRGKVARFF